MVLIDTKRDGVCNPVAYVLSWGMECGLPLRTFHTWFISPTAQNVSDGMAYPVRRWNCAIDYITNECHRRDNELA